MTTRSAPTWLMAAALLAGLRLPANAQPAGNPGPCAQITAACQSAGFVPGGIGTGAGLQADCVVPIMQGGGQPPQARIPLPQIDPRLVAECKAANPRFGQGTAQPVQQRATVACALGGETMPSGLVVVLPPGAQRNAAQDQQALNNPFISGAAAQIDWRDLEPVQGRPDWSKLDALFAAAEAANKWVQLLIFPGFFSPDWALQGAETDSSPSPMGPATAP
jgi:hypothetical protein